MLGPSGTRPYSRITLMIRSFASLSWGVITGTAWIKNSPRRIKPMMITAAGLKSFMIKSRKQRLQHFDLWAHAIVAVHAEDEVVESVLNDLFGVH